MKLENSKTMSSLHKDINRLRNVCTKINECNKLRKYQITQFNLFIKKLLLEERITKDEISKFMCRKENVKLN